MPKQTAPETGPDMAPRLLNHEAWLGEGSSFQEALMGSVREGSGDDRGLLEAMAYSVRAGGKRFRPYLLHAFTQAAGGPMELAAVPSVAVELVHTYSLIHDDLPAMDDDDLRRGMPTCHRAFGEALAILAGDALQSRAFEVLSSEGYRRLAGPSVAIRLVSELAAAIGPAGMAGGQAKDMRAEGGVDELRAMHDMKTGALIRFSTRAGALISGRCIDEADRLGFLIGRAFQVRDDILDATSTPEELGKTPGKDERQGKLTYVSAYGLDRARTILAELIGEARVTAGGMPCDSGALHSALDSLSL